MIDLTKLVRIGGAVVILFVAYLIWRGHERALGAREARIATLEKENVGLRGKVAQDSIQVAKHDTVRLFQRVTRADTVLQRLIDTAIVHRSDTVTVTREVLVEAKAVLDSTKKVEDDCCSLARSRAQRIAVLDSLNADLRRQIPSSARPWIDRGIGAGAVILAVWLGRR